MKIPQAPLIAAVIAKQDQEGRSAGFARRARVSDPRPTIRSLSQDDPFEKRGLPQ